MQTKGDTGASCTAPTGHRRAPQPQPQPGNLPPRTPQVACRALGGQPCPGGTPVTHPSGRSPPAHEQWQRLSAGGVCSDGRNPGRSPMLPPLWSCDPSGSRLHSAPPFLRPKTGGGHSFIGHREEEATNGPCLAPGRPEEPRMTWQPRAHPRANPAMGRRLGLQTAWRAGAQAPLEADPGRRARARGQCPVRGPWRERPGLRGCCRRTSQGPPQLLPWRGPELRGWSASPAPAPPRGAQRNGEQPAMLSPAVT